MLEIFELLFDPELNILIRESLPGSFVRFLEVGTVLGDGAVLFGLAALLYWLAPEKNREERVLILALAVSTLALSSGLKGILQVPRPLGYLAFAPETYPGWSTPSAHAMGATAVYGGFAFLKNKRLQLLRYVGAGMLIFFIATSRVVIGVHYVGDVLLGVILGGLLVFLAAQIKRNRTTFAMFGIAFLISIGAYLLGSEEYITLAVGSSLGGMISWKLLKYNLADNKCASLIMTGLLYVPILVIFWIIDSFVIGYLGLDQLFILEIPIYALVQITGYAILFGLVVALPYVAYEINHWSSVDKLEKLLPFSNSV